MRWPGRITAGRAPTPWLRWPRQVTPARGPVRTALRAAATLAAGVIAAGGLLVVDSGRGKVFDGLTRIVGGAIVIFVAVVLITPAPIHGARAPRSEAGGCDDRRHGAILAVGNLCRHPVRPRRQPLRRRGRRADDGVSRSCWPRRRRRACGNSRRISGR